jgi:hypothetical protein
MSEQYLSSQLLKIISGTPKWVWFVFGYLIFIGIRATGTRIVYIPKLSIIPLNVYPMLVENYFFYDFDGNIIEINRKTNNA